MKKVIILCMLLVLVFSLSACGTSESESEPETTVLSELPAETETSTETETPPVSKNEEQTNNSPAQDNSQGEVEEIKEMKLNIQIGDTTFYATLEKNSAVDAFIEMMKQAPVVIEMSDYSGFEKVGPLGQSLPTSNSQMATQAGDIVLYSGNQIVMFYGNHSWSYTKIAKIDDLSGWAEALGSDDVTVTFSIGE